MQSNTSPTQPPRQNNRHNHAHCHPPPRQSLRLFLRTLPPHRRHDFQSRRAWFDLTTLSPLDSISAPQRRHWEDDLDHHRLIALRIAAKHAAAAGGPNAQYYYYYYYYDDDDDDSDCCC